MENVTRSELSDGRTWREKGEKFNMGVMGPDELEMLRSRPCGRKAWERKWRGCEKTTREHRGEGEWVTWEREKESKKVIQASQYSTIYLSHGNHVKGVFQCICLVTVQSWEVLKQRPLGLERNGAK
jgi:hypothetical protein